MFRRKIDIVQQLGAEGERRNIDLVCLSLALLDKIATPPLGSPVPRAWAWRIISTCGFPIVFVQIFSTD